MCKNFWKDKIVLITGHTGFKGSWLCVYLLELGATVIGYSLESSCPKNNYDKSNLREKIIDITGDIKDYETLNNTFSKYNPDIVFHLAAQPIVIESYKNPINTYETNVIGTINVLECIKNLKKKVVGVIVTSDKCYENKEQLWGYREIDKLGGYDIYSSSKACCEILVSSYRNSFFNINDYEKHNKDISTVRAGNVIGGGDWSDYRLVPDCIKAFENNEKVIIRNSKSTRPWQHVLEPLSGYILLAEKMYNTPTKYSGAYNFGPQLKEVVNVKDLALKIAKLLKKDDLVLIEDNATFHEANLLFLDITKAKVDLNFNPVLSIDETINWTVEWYLNYKNSNTYNICKQQILKYISMSNSANKGV